MSLDDRGITVLDNSKETDITPKELVKIAEFKEAGMPGLASIAQNQVVLTKALDLYMSGKTYVEISKIAGIKKEIVLYLAHKFDWYGAKMEQLTILDANIKDRILQANLVNKDFVLQIQQFFLKKIGSKITRYLATGDDEIANKIDGKDLDRYQKYVELLDKLTTEKPSTLRQPTVGLNLGEGVSVKKVGENEVVITPKNKTVSEMLKELADLKRQEESKNSSNDITIEGSTKNQKESSNENQEND
jgi:antitoxin component of MazEF toxin-antitoxin module